MRNLTALMVMLGGSARRCCKAAEPLRCKYSSTIRVTTAWRGSPGAVTVLPISEGGRYAAVLLGRAKAGGGEDTPIAPCNDRLVLSTATFKQTHRLSEKLLFLGALCIECGRIDDEVEKIILLRRKRGEYGSWLVWSAHGECGHWQMSTIHARVVFIGYQVHIMLPASDRVRRQKPEERHGETARTYRRLGRGAHPFGSGSYGSQSHLMWSTQEVAIIRGLVQKLRMPVQIRII
jgi:hypothetical protein